MKEEFGFYIRKTVIKNLLSAHRKIADRGNVKSLIILTKFILKISNQFNKKLLSAGILEEKERKSSKGRVKKFKSLTEKGLKYGENAVSPHNQKEVQPLYYSDTFNELFEMVMND